MKMNLVRTLNAAKLIGLIAVFAVFASTSGFAQSTEVIVDNRDGNTSQVGSWSTSSGPYPYLGNSVYNNSGGSFSWYPVLPEPGDYDVYAWWTYHPKRSSTVPYRVSHVGPTVPVFVDQQDPDLAARWILLGTYTFTEAVVPEINVSSENGLANADAVRLVLRGLPSSINPRLKVIEVRTEYAYILGANTVTGLEAACPEGTLLTGGGVRKNRYSTPRPPTDTFDYFVGSSALSNMWIGEFFNPSDSAVTLYVEVSALCASIETH
jgi:hypothetical protein